MGRFAHFRTGITLHLKHLIFHLFVVLTLPIRGVLVVLCLLVLEEFLFLILVFHSFQCLLLKLMLSVHLITQSFVLLLKVNFLILENLIPLLLVLLMLLGHVERTRLEFNNATWLVMLRAELKFA